MTAQNEMPDAQFLDAFFDCTLSPSAFDHRAHVKLAWLLLREYELDEAVARAGGGIERFATKAGAHGKYHCTITEALMRLMVSGGARAQDVTWEQFCNANEMMLRNGRALLQRYYSPELLDSPEAKRRFVPPDRSPLP